MKSSKRITALLVALVFVLTSMMTVNVFADDDGFTDLDVNNSYYQAITSLVADGVINGYAEADGTFTFKPDNTITRAEFSKLLATASAPIGYAFNAATTQFPDVADANAEAGWAIPYIAYAVGTGAINGYEDGTFRPQNPVSYAEAVKMIVCTLGYGSVVDTTLTPWYQGYIDVANQIGLTTRAASLPTNDAPRGLVAQLIYNMKYRCKVYSAVVDSNGVSVNINNGNNTMDESMEGVLYGVFEYCLTGDDLTKQEVLIDDEIYQLGNYTADDLKSYVGYSVKFNISDERKKGLTKVNLINSENDSVIVEDWQIETVSGNEIEYYADENDMEDDEISNIKFSNNFYVVYNGRVVEPKDIDDEFIEKYLDVTTGKIEFISNDGNDKNAEVAIVESYDLYFVKSSSTVNDVTTFYETNAKALGIEDGIVIDKKDALDAEDEPNVTKISSKGGSATKSSLSNISKNSTVAVAVPYDTKEGTKVIISSASFSGSVKEIPSNGKYIKIGNDEYKFSPYFEAIKDGGVDVSLDVGDTAKFYLDHMGRISFFDKTESSNPYGLLIMYATGSGVDSATQVKLMNTSGKINDYFLKEPVRINGKSYDDASEAIKALEESCPTYSSTYEKNITQVVKYVTGTQNGNTVISELETVDMDKLSGGNIVPHAIKNDKNSEKTEFANGGKLTYETSGNIFKFDESSQFTVNSSTVVFIVPENRNDTTKYLKRSYTYFSDEGKYCVEPYDVETGKSAKVVIYYLAKDVSASGSVDASTPVSFVNEVKDASNDDGELVKKLVYRVAGSDEIKEALSSTETDIKDKLETLEPGDLVKIYVEDGEIIDVKTVYVDGALTTETGNIKDGNSNYITKDNSSTQKEYYQVMLGTVYSCNSDDKKIDVIPAFVGDDDFDADAWRSFKWTDTTTFFDFDEKNEEFVTSSDGALRGYVDDEKTPSQVIIVVMNSKVVAVYDLAE